jgi:hypothetical protein
MGALLVRGRMPAVEVRGDEPLVAAPELEDEPWSQIRRDQV